MVDATKREAARRLRREDTLTEKIAWRLLRDRRLAGLKFRRQTVIAGFIVDFFCDHLQLVIEVDGGVHEEPEHRAADEQRTRVLEASGVRVIRVDNSKLTRAWLIGVLEAQGVIGQEHNVQGQRPSSVIDHGQATPLAREEMGVRAHIADDAGADSSVRDEDVQRQPQSASRSAVRGTPLPLAGEGRG